MNTLTYRHRPYMHSFIPYILRFDVIPGYVWGYDGKRISNNFCGEKRLESETNRICKSKMMAITVLLYNRPQEEDDNDDDQ